MQARRALALTFAFAFACGEPSDGARAAIEARGFHDVEIVRRSEGVVVFEAEKGGERCTGEVRFAPSGDARIASRCEDVGALAELERGCEAGDAEACAEAAAGVRASPPIDWSRATRLAQAACEGGLPRECLHVGMAHELGGRGVDEDATAARAMYERACAAGSPPACTRRDAMR